MKRKNRRISRTIGKAFAWYMGLSFMVSLCALDSESWLPLVWLFVSFIYLAALAKHHGYMM